MLKSIIKTSKNITNWTHKNLFVFADFYFFGQRTYFQSNGFYLSDKNNFVWDKDNKEIVKKDREKDKT